MASVRQFENNRKAMILQKKENKRKELKGVKDVCMDEVAV